MKHLKSTFVSLLALTAASDAFTQGPPGPPPMGGGLERLGEFAFHRLINRFVVDITEPIVAAYGEIHRYVGDELIATWKSEDGIAARIQEFCRQTGNRVLASAALVDLLELPFGITKRPLGDLHLRGKESDVVLYALKKERADNAAAAA